MDVRYQVFISSTFYDLKDERSAVFQTLMAMDCIPAGMELFPAMDEEQFKFIQRIIDDSDYYILIIGGRYGSVSSAGVSYTEMEYDYAVDRGLKVLAFIHQEPGEIPSKFIDSSPDLQAKLAAFREKVKSGRLVQFWKDGAELPGLVALSLNKTVKTYPAIGWIRANKIASEAAVQEQNALLKQIESLKEELKVAQRPNLENPDLAHIDDEVTVSISWLTDNRYNRRQNHQIALTWRQLFVRIAPELHKHPNDASVNFALGETLLRVSSPSHKHTVSVDPENFKLIRTHLQALGLIIVNYMPTVKGDMGLFWSLTDLGHAMLLNWGAAKRKSEDSAIPTDWDV